MKIPVDAVIPREKLTQYLLVPRPKNDKSQYLAQANFTQENPDALEAAIRQLISENDAVLDRQNEYGDYYKVQGILRGINHVNLDVVTIWIVRTNEDGVYRFVTLKPNRE